MKKKIIISEIIDRKVKYMKIRYVLIPNLWEDIEELTKLFEEQLKRTCYGNYNQPTPDNSMKKIKLTKDEKRVKPFDIDCNRHTWGKMHEFCRKTFDISNSEKVTAITKFGKYTYISTANALYSDKPSVECNCHCHCKEKRAHSSIDCYPKGRGINLHIRSCIHCKPDKTELTRGERGIAVAKYVEDTLKQTSWEERYTQEFFNDIDGKRNWMIIRQIDWIRKELQKEYARGQLDEITAIRQLDTQALASYKKQLIKEIEKAKKALPTHKGKMLSRTEVKKVFSSIGDK